MFQKLWALVKAPVNKAIDNLQAKFPPNRIVVLLTPTVFVPVSAWLSGYVAAHFPGLPQFSSSSITGIMVAGGISALGLAYKWVDGWQKHERMQADPNFENVP